jgi:hypothetical protein
MTAGWILIIAINTTGGKFVEKIEFGTFPTKKACMAVKIEGLNQWKLSKVCVSKAHWEGRTIDPGVTPD